MENKLLAIAIPTYNRAEILKENLLYMMNEIQEYNIPIYISDDSSNDETEKMVFKLKEQYEYIYYTKNIPSLGHDKNCFSTINLPDTDYIWYLGDSINIKSEGIKIVLDILTTQNVDVLFVNAKSRTLDSPSGIKTNKNEILSTLGWHLTQTGASIYSRNKLHLIDNINLKAVKNFPQFALIFEILDNNGSAYWVNEKLIFNNLKKRSYWSTQIFDVFLNDWTSAVNSLGTNFTIQAKNSCILKHSLKTKLFSFKSLLRLKYRKVFSMKILSKYKKELKKHSKVPYIILILIALTPVYLLKVFKK